MKSAGVMMFSRTMRRIVSLLRLRRGRGRCSTHGRPRSFVRSTPSATLTADSPSHTELVAGRSRLEVATTPAARRVAADDDAAGPAAMRVMRKRANLHKL